MKLQVVSILVSLCGAVLAAPTNDAREDRLWWPTPGGDGEGLEPTLPIPSFRFPTSLEDLVESGLPFPTDLGDLVGANPGQPYDPDEQDDESPDLTTEEDSEN
ncbi:hypothetical protein BDV18DRAFT_144031 [Aspergillus unguis]